MATNADVSWPAGDLPIEGQAEDWGLGYREYAEALCGILESADTPFVLGVYGDWGMGKTSLMNCLREEAEEKQHATVWFNPWKYDKREAVWKALIRAVYGQVRAQLHFLSFDRPHVTEALKKGGRQALDMLGRLAGVGDTGQEIESLFTLDPTFANAFESAFENQLNQLLKNDETKRLVIFIDDLDRCEPGAVIEVLEALKLYLDVKHCVFVLGVAQDVVEKAVRHKYAKPAQGQESPIDGMKYLEKIVQLPFYIPPADEKKRQAFCARAVAQFPSPDPEKAAEWWRNTCRVAEHTHGNPRQIKRFLATALLIHAIAPPELDRLKLAKVVLLQFAFPHFYELLQRYPQLLHIYQQQVLAPRKAPEAEEEAEPAVSEAVPMREEETQRAQEVFRDPGLAAILREEPHFEDEDEAKRYISYSAPGRPAAEPPDFEKVYGDLMSDRKSIVEAAAALVKEQDEDTRALYVDRLLADLGAEEAKQRADAAWALGWIGEAAAVQPLIEALTDHEWGVRGNAAFALGRIGGATAPRVRALIEALDDAERPVRLATARALGASGPAGVQLLIEALQDGTPPERDGAAFALGEIGDVAAAAALTAAMGDDYALVRSDAAAALGKIGDAAAVPALIEALKDDDGDVRAAAAIALGRISAVEAVKPLTEALKDHGTRVRANAAFALGRIAKAAAPAAPTLIGALKDDSPGVRGNAALALGQIGEARSVEPLIEALKDDHPLVGSNAADALARIGTPEALEALKEHGYDVPSDEPHDDVRET